MLERLRIDSKDLVKTCIFLILSYNLIYGSSSSACLILVSLWCINSEKEKKQSIIHMVLHDVLYYIYIWWGHICMSIITQLFSIENWNFLEHLLITFRKAPLVSTNSRWLWFMKTSLRMMSIAEAQKIWFIFFVQLRTWIWMQSGHYKEFLIWQSENICVGLQLVM